MSESIRETLERARNDTFGHGFEESYRILDKAIIEALTQLEAWERDREAMEKLRAEVKIGFCPILVFDDNGMWTVSYEGTQAVGVTRITTTTVILDPDMVVWFDDPADAILGTQEQSHE